MKPEEAVHRAVVAQLRERAAPGLVWWHTPNGAYFGRKGAIHGRKLKELGMRPGVSDLLFLRNGELFGLELKAGRNAPTEEQLKWMSDMNNAGGYACAAVGQDEAIAIMETWQLVTGRTI